MAANPEGELGGLGRDVTLREALDAAEGKLSSSLVDSPLVEASVRKALSMSLWSLGKFDRSLGHARRAYELFESKLGPDDDRTLSALRALASACHYADLHDEGIRYSVESVARHTDKCGKDHTDTLRAMIDWAKSYRFKGDLDSSVELLKDCAERYKPTFGGKEENLNKINAILNITDVLVDTNVAGAKIAAALLEGWIKWEDIIHE